jgi:hypothetical protein
MFRFDREPEEEFPEGPRHFPAAELDPAVPCRNPLDPAPYPEDFDADAGSSFPSLFLPVLEKRQANGLADAELQSDWERLQALINKCLDTGSTPRDTVDMVYEFYSEHIKTSFVDAPDWGHKSIYNYIYRDFDRQATENIHAINHTVEFLRTQLASRQADGTVKVNSENVKLFLAATKAHAGLVDAKRKREQR